MAGEVNITGHEGTLAVAVDDAWKPVGCLTSSEYSATINMFVTANMVTNGETVQKPNNLTRSVQIEGEVIDTTSVGGSGIDQSFDELRELQETQVTGSKVAAQWRLSRGPLGYLYFEGYISDLSDNYAAG